MTRAQRLTFLGIAVAIAIAAVVLLTGGDDETPTAAQPAATATATAEPEAAAASEPTATPQPRPPLVEPGRVAKLRFTEGDTVRFRVRADTPGEIHVHGYDIESEVGPRPRTIAFEADITGIFEVELHATGEQVAELRVDPR